MRLIFLVLLCFFLILSIFVVPFLSIWSCNTLFNTEIPYSLKTWFASLWLIVIFCRVYPKSDN